MSTSHSTTPRKPAARTAKTYTLDVLDDDGAPVAGCTYSYHRIDGYMAYYAGQLVGCCDSAIEAQTMSLEAKAQATRVAAMVAAEVAAEAEALAAHLAVRDTVSVTTPELHATADVYFAARAARELAEANARVTLAQQIEPTICAQPIPALDAAFQVFAEPTSAEALVADGTLSPIISNGEVIGYAASPEDAAETLRAIAEPTPATRVVRVNGTTFAIPAEITDAEITAQLAAMYPPNRPDDPDEAAASVAVPVGPRAPQGGPTMAVAGKIVTGQMLADLLYCDGSQGRAALVALFAEMTQAQRREAILLLVYHQNQQQHTLALDVAKATAQSTGRTTRAMSFVLR